MDVLIIDDRETNINRLKNELARQESFEINIIGSLTNPKELSKYFINIDKFPSVVFLDKTFDNDSSEGFVLAKEIKEKSRDVKIVLMTDFENKKEFVEFHSLGLIDGYIRNINIFNNKTLRWVLTGLESYTPYFDVPSDWLNYSIEDNDQSRRVFTRKKIIKEQRITIVKKKIEIEDLLKKIDDQICDFESEVSEKQENEIIKQINTKSLGEEQVKEIVNWKVNSINLTFQKEINVEAKSKSNKERDEQLMELKKQLKKDKKKFIENFLDKHIQKLSNQQIEEEVVVWPPNNRTFV